MASLSATLRLEDMDFQSQRIHARHRKGTSSAWCELETEPPASPQHIASCTAVDSI